MSGNWHTVKVKYTKEHRDGTLKRLTEPYLVNASSFTDAEARIYKEVGEYVRGEFLVTSIVKTDFADIFFFDDAEVWYKAKVSYVTEDADSGKEKRINNNFLVTAHNVKEAYERLEESLKGLMATYSIPIISETQIQEVFTYQPPEEIDLTAAGKAMSNALSQEDEEFVSPNINVAYAADEEE